MITGLVGIVTFTFIIVFLFKETFGGRKRKLKEGEKYTYRKLPTESYELNKILDKAREEKDYETEFITVKKINKLRPKTNLWTFNELFRFYYNGLGTKKNEKKALRYLMHAYKKNYAPARYSYGSYLLDKKRYKEAAEVFRAGYLEGLGRCSFGLYKMMADGLIETDKTERFQALFIAKEQKVPEAIEIYDSYEEHRRFLSLSPQDFANQFDRKFSAYPGLVETFEDDHPEYAAELALEGALLGSSEMQRKYSRLLYRGHGIPKDDHLSFIFALAAARQDNTQAMMDLGYMYNAGVGCEANMWSAVDWFEAAIAKGCTDAYGPAGIAYSRLVFNGSDKYADRAFELLRIGVESGGDIGQKCQKVIDNLETHFYRKNL